MNILTFDIEEWYIEKEYNGGHAARYAEYDRILGRILDMLDSRQTKATFFCLGRIATDFPQVVKSIAARGHEIGSHSHAHKWVNKMTRDEFRADTLSAIHALEDVTGEKVVSFRAPAFSIGESNKWAIEVLAECGIKNDASIFPGVRDFGGFPTFNEHKPCRIEYNSSIINEFPIPLYKLPLISKELAYSGGGYFRLIPLNFINRRLVANDYNMCYFHIADLLTEKSKLMSKAEYERYFKEPGTVSRRYMRYIKQNIGRAGAVSKLEYLIQNYEFVSIEGFLSLEQPQTIVSI